jgi:hypothetical protein
MHWTSVAAIMQGGNDSVGASIVSVYAKQPPLYAVYRTKERVAIQYADEESTAKAQRGALAKLNAVRGEINGLIDSWRSSSKARRESDAKRFDRRVADALIVALEGDADNAATLLDTVKIDIVDTRTSWARFQYLIVASVTAACGVALLAGLSSGWFNTHLYQIPGGALDMLPAAAAGTIGGFFSIAIALRSRTVLTDLHFRDNAADAALRVVIGLIAAALLICLVKTKAASIAVGDTGSPGYDTLNPLIVGFLAGFSERLIPDLLAETAIEIPSNPTPGRLPAGAAASNAAPGANAGDAGAVNGGAGATIGGGAPSDVAGDKDPASMTDNCLCNVPLQPGEATPDSELPATSGGVAAHT